MTNVLYCQLRYFHLGNLNLCFIKTENVSTTSDKMYQPVLGSNACQGIHESQIIPLLFSSVTATELCLMFLIERDKSDIWYRSRNCEEVAQNEYSYCSACSSLFENLKHFHHLHINKSCKEFSDSVQYKKDDTEKSSPSIELEKKINRDGEIILNKVEFVSDEEKVEEEAKLFNICEKCGQIFESKLSLDEHTNTKCTDIVNNDIKVDDFSVQSANVNDAISQVTNDMKKTEKQMSKKRLNVTGCFTCQKCCKVFTKKASLYAHKRKVKCEHKMKIHGHRTRYAGKCKLCPLKIGKGSMYRHLVTAHYNERDNPIYKEMIDSTREKHVCPYCGQEFSSKPVYQSHCQSQHKDFIVQKAELEMCVTCGKGFTDKKHLKEHTKHVHEKDPVMCVECDKTFQHRRSFISHVRKVHDITEEKCPECDKVLKNKIRLVGHMRRVHIKDKDLHNKCNECPKAFYEKNMLLAHISKVHKQIRPYCCEMCKYKASSPFNLNLHRAKMHQATDHISRLQLIEMIKEGKHPNCGTEFLELLRKPTDDE